MEQAKALTLHLRARDAAAYLGISISTLWRWASEGRIPRPIRLSARCTVWPRQGLDDFIRRQAETEGCA